MDVMDRCWRGVRAGRRALLTMSVLGGVLGSACGPEDPDLTDNAMVNMPDHGSTPTPDMPGGEVDMAVDMAPAIVLEPGVDVTIASFNVERLFDETCDSGQCGSGDFEEVPSTLSLDSKIDRIQRAVQKIDADVIVFQEIEKEALLDRVMASLKAEYPTQVFGETGFSASLDVAVVSRGSFVKKVTHRQESIPLQSGGDTQFAREFLEVHLDVEGARVIVFGAHFISKRTSGSEPRRWAEANAAGKLAAEVSAQNPDALVAIAGDLNDTPDSLPIQAIADSGVTIPGRMLDRAVYYTHVYNSERQILDHVLYMDTDKVQLHPNGFIVTRDEGRDGLGGSDHASPRATFRVAQ